MAQEQKPQRKSVDEFVFLAIKKLPKPPYKGMHVRFSGFNEAFREYYKGEFDPETEINRMVAEGKLSIRPSKGGPTVYVKGEDPSERRVKQTLNTILG